MGPGWRIRDKFMEPAGPFRIGDLWRPGGLTIDTHWLLEFRRRPGSDDPPPSGNSTFKCFNCEVSGQWNYDLNAGNVSDRHHSMRTRRVTRLQNNGCRMIPP